MIISDVKTYLPWGGPRAETIVKVETDSGLEGWGCSGMSAREWAVEGAVRHFRDFLIGRDPMQIGALWQELYRSQYFEGGRVLTAAISAIDIALHDLKGKALGVPVYELLGGKHRDFVPGFATASAPYGPELVEDVLQLHGEGWPAIRLGLGTVDAGHDGRLFEPRESIGLTAEWVIRVREALGQAPVLGLDYHHRLTVAEAASFCQRLPRAALDFLEEPIRDQTPEAYEALRSMTDVPFAIGEEFESKWQALPYIERGLANFMRIDICNVGGFTEALKVAAWCEAHYIDVMPHNPVGPLCTAASVHFLAAIPNCAWLEVRTPPRGPGGEDNSDATPERRAIYPKQVEIDGTWYPLPTEPGLGIAVDEEVAASQALRPWNSTLLHRRDGSYTNF